MDKKILIEHGSGGRMTRDLIRELFYPHLHNDYLDKESDAAVISDLSGLIAVSTDAFVVSPMIFPGGDIGKLAVCGTINDVVVSGAVPHSITASFILEEGLSFEVLEKIVMSMASEISQLGIKLLNS